MKRLLLLFFLVSFCWGGEMGLHATTYSDWVNANFSSGAPLTGMNDNPAGDGTPNLMKYALGMNPNVNSQNGLPVTFIGTDGNLSISFTEDSSLSDVTYVVETSSDLQNWFWGPGAAVETSSVPLGGTLSRVTYEAPLGPATFGNLFIRLYVCQGAPTMPGYVTATPGYADQIHLTWSDDFPGVTGFLIEESFDGGVTWSEVADLGPNATFYDVTGLDQTQTYEFEVVAENNAGSTASSPTSPMQPPPAPAQYAVIDLGVNMFPAKVTNSGYVLGLPVGPTGSLLTQSAGWVWYNGQIENLQPNNSSDPWQVNDIGEDGTMIGSEDVQRSYTLTWSGSGSQPNTYQLSISDLATWAAGTPANPMPSQTASLTDGPVLTNVNPSYTVQGQAFYGGVGIAANDSIIFSYKSLVSEYNYVYPQYSVDLYNNAQEVGKGYYDSNGDCDVAGLVQHNNNGDMLYSDTYGNQWMNSTPLDFSPLGISNEVMIGGVTKTYVVGWNWVGGNPSLVWWNGTDHTDLTQINAYYPAINGATATITDTNGNPETAPAIQIVAGPQTWEMNPSTGQFGAPLLLDNLVPVTSHWNMICATGGANFYNQSYASNSFQPLNDSGVIAATATQSDTNGNPELDANGNPVWHGILMVETELAVDADRNGTIVLANENPSGKDANGNPVDSTSQAKPYRFWINNDEDSGTSSPYGADVLASDTNTPVSSPDCNSTYITSVRDLEDWTRLWIYTKGLNAAINSGQIKVGLKWKQVVSGTPGIELVTASDADGGLEYLQDGTLAAGEAQVSPDPNDPGNISGAPVRLLLKDANTLTTMVIPTGNTADFVFPQWVWTNLTDAKPESHFLFEGASEGMGQLEIVFLKRDGVTEIGEGGSLWLDLHDIKEMYQREKAEPETITAPYDYGTDTPTPISMTPQDDSGRFTFSPDPNETKDYFIFVHGWNMSYLGSTNYAETMFKRFWWRGYKGRFVAFRWPTYYSNVDEVAALQASLARYNDSEYIAWESGQALAQYVNSLPSAYTRHIAAHSMGNVVVASALQQSQPLSVSNYALLHAAIPANCYDTNTALEQSVSVIGGPTPDHDPDPATSSLAYRSRVTSTGQAVLTSFYDTTDVALAAWVVNNNYEKPQLLYAGFDGLYFYEPDALNGQKLGLETALASYRFMTDKYESMAYADKALTLTVGAESRTAGLINAGVNMNARYNFNGVHSAEFNWPIQQLGPYYYDLLKNLDISENYLDSSHPAFTP